MKIRIAIKTENRVPFIGDTIIIREIGGFWNSSAGGICPLNPKIPLPFKAKVENMVFSSGLGWAVKAGDYGFSLDCVKYEVHS